MTARGTEHVTGVPLPRPAGGFEVVVVSYRSRDLVEALLARLPNDQPVVVVDNAGGADGVDDLVRRRPRARYLDGGGEGFAVAANLGARSSCQPFVVFANPDSEPDHSTYVELVRALVEDPGVASASALLVDGHGRPEIGGSGWEPSLVRALMHSTGLHWLFPRAGIWARPRVGRPVDVDWTTGAALAARRSDFLALGGFDETFYVYNEDVAFGAAVRAAGMRQLLRTDLVVRHASGGSGAPSRQMMRLRGASMAQYLARGRSAPYAWTTRVVLALGYAVRAVGERAVGRRHRWDEHLSWAAGVLSGRAVVGGREVSRSRAVRRSGADTPT